jgi:hypothetical protein
MGLFGTEMTPQVRRATAVLAVSQVIGWGTTFYLPAIFGADMARDLGLSSEFVFAGVTLFVIMMGLLGPSYGRLLDRRGAPPFMAVGSGVTALALFSLANAEGPVTYVISWIALGIGAALTLGMPSFVSLAHVAGGRARSSMVVLMLFSGLSSSVFWPVMGILQPLVGWRTTCLIFMTLNFGICLPLYALVLPRRAAPGSAAAAELPPPAPPAIATAQRRTVFLLMAPGFAISGFISWGMSLHMVALLIGMGLSAATALVLGSSIGALQVAGRVVDYRWGGRLTPDKMGLVSATVLLLAFPLIFAGFGVPAIALIFVVLYSLATGQLAIARTTMPFYVFGSAAYGTYAGRFALVQNIAYAFAPIVFAAVIDKAGVAAGLLLAFVSAIVAFVFFGLTVQHLKRYPFEPSAIGSQAAAAPGA